MTPSERNQYLHRLRFEPDIERAFQQDYFSRIRGGLCRVHYVITALFFLGVLWGLFDGLTYRHWNLELPLFAALMVVNLVVIRKCYEPGIFRYWQPLVVGATLLSFGAPELLLSNSNFPGIQLTGTFLLLTRIQKLQYRWIAVELLGFVVVGAISFARPVLEIVQSGIELDQKEWGAAGAFAVLFLLFLVWPVYATLKHERHERREYITKYLLEQERDDERGKREQTERMLQVLNQAIGGIVHDLGNPLTMVRGGAESLTMFHEQGELDPETLREFLEMITDGTRMLEYLRMSLIEQTRVLEGRPVPIEKKPVSISRLVKAGVLYQKPRFAHGRQLNFEGDEVEVCVDEMRFITVFMNLIGNSLKYSDGEILIDWRVHEKNLLVAVQDQGCEGKGISKTQAEKLFQPFARLDSHNDVEGTGLGLLSVRSIAEAHGGEIYIEGYENGTTDSPFFHMGCGEHSKMLRDNFRTAFVMVFPLGN